MPAETKGRIASHARSGLRKSLGPGLIWAAAAVGVSHLVQSTRAGATFGFSLVGAVVLANLFKYPFFEFGPRYAAATGESLVEGYRRLGRWAVGLYLLLTLATMFAVVGAVTFVTGSLATQIFGGIFSPLGYSGILLAVSVALLVSGRYPLLDGAVKVIMAALTVSTLAAVGVAWVGHTPVASAASPPPLWGLAGFSFLIALVGWMPSAVDISVWHSLWSLERARQTGYRPRLSEALFDFNLGYVGTALLAVAFLCLGALVLYGSGETVASSGGAFAAQLLDVYTRALGSWARPLIAVAAFTTMFSTTLTCTDAFPRALERTTGILAPGWIGGSDGAREWVYRGWMAVVVVGSLLLISTFRNRLTLMVDVATTLSFLTAPVLGYFNYRVVTAPHMPEEARPPLWLKLLSWVGLLFGVVFGAVFLWVRFARG